MLIRSLLAFLVVTAAATLPAAEPCWPQWRGPDRDGKAHDARIRTDWDTNPPQLLWTEAGFGEGFASMAIVGERLYTTGNVGGGQAVTAFDLSSRKMLWQTPITDGAPQHGYGGSRSTPTVDGDRLYVTSSGGGVACLDVRKGKLLWSKKFGDEYGSGSQSWGYAESPLVDGDLVIVTPGGKDALMVALDKQTGSEVWRTPYAGDLGDKGKQEAGYSSIVISNAAGVKQYVQMTGKGLVGVRASDGKLLWNENSVANGTAVIPTPLVQGDYVFASSGYGTGAALVKLSKAGKGCLRRANLLPRWQDLPEPPRANDFARRLRLRRPRQQRGLSRLCGTDDRQDCLGRKAPRSRQGVGGRHLRRRPVDLSLPKRRSRRD